MTGSGARPAGMFKVAFDLEPVSATWPPFSTERIWAKKGLAPYELILHNIPFYVRGLSCGDTIRAKPDHDRRELVFDGLVRHAGSSTIRVILRDKRPEMRERVLAIFSGAGCSWEFSNVDFHLAVDIPKVVDYGTLRAELLRMISDGSIEVEEAFIAENHQDGLE